MSAGAIVATVNGALQTFENVYNEWKSTQAHPSATVWVAQVQNPFGASLALIVNAKDAEIKAGNATADDVYFAENAVKQLWASYREKATAFAALGVNQSQVIQQSYTTLQPLINQIIADMDRQTAQLGGVSAVALATGENLSHFSYLIWFIGFLLVTLVVIRLRS
jgi:hypothetical protein